MAGRRRDSKRETEILVRWSQGWSASTIARHLGNGTTRNAVIGVVFRARRSGIPTPHGIAA